MMLEGLTALLTLDSRLQVVGTASTISSMQQQLASWSPDVLLVDYLLPDGVIADHLEGVRQVCPTAAVLVLSGTPTSSVTERVLLAGADGIVGKGIDTDELSNAIVTVASGGVIFPATIVRDLARQDLSRPGATLTERERDVLQLLTVPNSASEIAQKLELSPHTVRSHIRAILTKLDANSQLEAVLVALRHGLVDLSDRK